MLRRIADDVLVRESAFLQSNTVVVEGWDGVLVVDPGITRDELAELADDIRRLGRPVIAGFSTHADWDHVLWHPGLGDVPRYATARAVASIEDQLAAPDWPDQLAQGLPPEHADEIPIELLGLLAPLPAGATRVPWDGPVIRIVEHRAHAPGHAALLVERSRVLIAGDMLSDILMPFLDLSADAPLDDYDHALELFAGLADDVDVVIPGHGSVGAAGSLRPRIADDRAYIAALREQREPDDARVGPSAPLFWLPDVHRGQVERLARRSR
jgi:glyoxylase-like metal-dependent hydrolase (beta-lactamase superfamily II)